MVEMARPVIDFLNRANAEKPAEEKDRALEPIIEKAKSVALSAIKPVEVFRAPVVTVVHRKASDPTISYRKPLSQVQKVKKALGVTTYREVGERTFEYFVKQELPS